ncbi:MAG: phytanoyl-CoA dioxygenase family protein, partial [Kovacikia sp.]
FFFCRPGTPGFTRHQDNFYVQSQPDAFASAWVALEDVSALNGGLILYPGSHREPILPTEMVEQPDNIGQDPNANRQQVILPRSYPAIDVSLPKGAAVFIHGHIVHQSHPNATLDRFRQALLMLYLRQGAPFRPGFSAGRTKIDVYRSKP